LSHVSDESRRREGSGRAGRSPDLRSQIECGDRPVHRTQPNQAGPNILSERAEVCRNGAENDVGAMLIFRVGIFLHEFRQIGRYA